MLSFKKVNALLVRKLLFLTILVSVSCNQTTGCSSSKTEPKKPTKQEKPRKLVQNLPAVNMSGLSEKQKTEFIRFANEEICPCECALSFAECLQSDDQCKPAVILARWMKNIMKTGLPLETLAEPVSKEISMGFRARPMLIDLDGYATKGAKDPTVTIVEFADFQCAHCQSTADALSMVVKLHPKDVKVVFKHFPLDSHPTAKKAAIASEAAAKQGKFWPMHDLLFSTLDPLSDELINEFAKKAGIKGASFEKFKADLTNPDIINKVQSSMNEAKILGISATPSIYFNGRPYHLSLDIFGLEVRNTMEKARTEPFSCELK